LRSSSISRPTGRWAQLFSLADANDGWLTLDEAQPAYAEFKVIADADRDDRVTPTEYAPANEFIAARW
jgi:hypothetical protein